MRFLLAPLSWVYSSGMEVRNRLYDSEILPRHGVRRPVISVGNLSAGGTGKTPVVQWLCTLLEAEGVQPAIVLRGYGGREKGPALVPPKIHNLFQFSLRFGDEAAVYRQRLPEIPIGIGGDRVANTRNLLDGYEADVVIADDAFQHRRLKRDLEIVLVDATKDIRRQRVLPWGYLREPMKNLARAQVVFLTKCNLASEEVLNANREWLKNYCSRPIFELEFILRPFKERLDQEVVVLSALGNPKAFERSIELDLNLKIQKHFCFRDHHRYSKQDINSVVQYCQAHSIRDLVVSEKDFVKLNPEDFEGIQLHTTCLDVVLMDDEQKIFLMQTLKKVCRL